MNLINDLAKIRIIFFIIVLSGFYTSKAFSGYTNLPFPIQPSYLSSFTGNTIPLGDLNFDDAGLIYLSTDNSIIISNGVREQYITVKAKSNLVAGDFIFFYTGSDAGFIMPDSSGIFKVKSFNSLFNDQSYPFTEISDLQISGNDIYISANSRLYHIKNNTINVADTNFINGRMFMAGSTLLIYKSGKGIKKAGSTFNAEDYKSLGGFVPGLILKHNDGFLMYSSEENRFLIYSEELINPKKWNPFFTQPVMLAAQSVDKYFFYSTDNQVIVTNNNGQKDPLLLENIISPVFDVKKLIIKDNKLWLLQNKQLSYIEYPPVLIKSSLFGLTGLTNSVIATNDYYCFGTNEGLYYFSTKDGEKVKTLNSPLISLEKTNDGFIAHSDNGLFKVDELNVYVIHQGNVNAYYFDKSENILYYSLPGKILSRNLNGLSKSKPDILLEDVEANILFVDNLILRFSDGNKTGHVEINNNSTDTPYYFQSPGEKILDIFKYKGRILYLTKSNLFEFRDETFISVISSAHISRANKFFNIALCEEEILWINMSDNKGNFSLWNSSDVKEFFQFRDQSFTEAYPAAVTLKDENNYIISSGDRVFLYYLNDHKLQKRKHSIYINRLITSEDSIFNGLNYKSFQNIFISQLNNIPYKNRNLKIEVSTSEYSNSSIYFRFEIHGRQKYSTSWSDSPEIEFKKLKPGLHKISVFSYCPTNDSAGESFFSINIRTPFFQQWWAIILYILVTIIILFIIYKSLIYKYLRNPPNRNSQVSTIVTKEVPQTQLFTDQVKPIPSDKSKWEKFEMATVLFSDIQGFSKIAEQMNPEMLIDELDKFFFHFDSVCEKYNIEKIKTIGDAYMAAGGIPRQNSTNPIEVALAALEMQNYVKQLKNNRTDIWDLRIGIHSGPVIGGVIGHKKRSYDIWGDTVNIASRMESSGEAGYVNISGKTYSLIKEYFICEYRGKLPVKYKGNIEMYFVKGLRPELSINLGTLPNRIFFFKMQLLRLRDLEKFIFYKLETELSKNIYFHNFEYIKNMYIHANLLSRAENLTVEEDLIIKTTVLFLYTGLLTSYPNYQNKSADYAERILPDYNYSKPQISAIYNLILFAKMQHEPQSQMEGVMHDLLTEFYGRVDYIHNYKLLFLELNENARTFSISGWKEQQVKAIRKHNFCTRSAISLREVSAEQQIKNIELDQWA